MLISLKHLTKSFELAGQPFHALRNVDLDIEAGELVVVVVVGSSGSGKSTLLNMVAGLDRPSAGEVEVGGVQVHALNEDGLAHFRANNVGVVFQFFQLLPTLTVIENVLLAMDFVGKVPASRRRERAEALLERVGVVDQMAKFPATLSGGQQQRVAIARALANDPAVVVADEPTGNLDSRTSAHIIALFEELVAGGKTVLLVTHDVASRTLGSRVVTLVDGQVN